MEIIKDVWNSVNNWTEIIFQSVIWRLLHLNLRCSFYSVGNRRKMVDVNMGGAGLRRMEDGERL